MDLDHDGQHDVLSGSWPGEITLFRGAEAGQFLPGRTLTALLGKPVWAGKGSAVHACDWDQDGDLDLLVGVSDGPVYFVPNLSQGQGALLFGRPHPLQQGGERLESASGDAGPFAADWDGDGDLDLLLGCGDGGVLYYETLRAQPGALPRLAPPRVLIGGAPDYDHNSPDGHGHEAKVCVSDWNGDGLLDLLLGDLNWEAEAQGAEDYHGNVWLYLRRGPQEN